MELNTRDLAYKRTVTKVPGTFRIHYKNKCVWVFKGVVPWIFTDGCSSFQERKPIWVCIKVDKTALLVIL
jgi:hypothetical protein